MRTTRTTPLEGSPLGSPADISSTGRSVRAMFAAVAPRYDFLNHFLSAGLDIIWRRATARALRGALREPDSVALDVCCGTGDLAIALRRVAKGRVIAADFCAPMFHRARSKFRRIRQPIGILGADTLSLPFASSSADVVASGFGFRNLASYSDGLRELWRVLKPGGTLAILEFSRVRWPLFGPMFRLYFAAVLPRLGAWISGVPGAYVYLHDSASRFPDQDAFSDALRNAGFKDIRCRDFAGGVAALHIAVKASDE